MRTRYLLTNARLVQPDRLVEGGSLLVEDGRIADLTDRSYPAAPGVLDLGGRLLLPGLVDLHNDGLEREINPRPGANFAPAFALIHLDRKLAAAGVTTQFHAITFGERGSFGRSVAFAAELCGVVHEHHVAPHAAVENLILHRLDLRSQGALEALLGLLDRAVVPFVSLNDHVPGQGQYRDLATFRRQIRPFLNKEDVSEAELDTLINQRLQRAVETEPIVVATLTGLMAAGQARRLVLASHDDDSPARVDLMREVGCTIAEFPVTLAAAERARALDMWIVMGAPNALRGASLTGNTSALDLLTRGLCDILVADYHAPSLLAAVGKVVDAGLLDLPAAVRLLTANPAAAVGLNDRGALVAGRRADLIVVERQRGVPVVDATFVAGQLRYTAGPFAPATAVLGQPAPLLIG